MIAKDLSKHFCPVPKMQDRKQQDSNRKTRQIKCKKHKQTRATEISQKVKKAVWERDKHRCIVCYELVPVTCANAHFMKRSQRRKRHRREYSHTMPRMSLSRRPRTRD